MFFIFILLANAAEHLPVKVPSLLLPSGVQTVKVLLKGDNLQLECIPGGLYVNFQHKCNAQISVCLFLIVIASCCSPIPSITWMKLGESLTDRVKLTNFKRLLTINSVDQKDQGKYMCTAENSAGKAVHYFDVTVEGESEPADTFYCHSMKVIPRCTSTID